METALIISNSEKEISSIANILKSVTCKKVFMTKTYGNARRLVLEKHYGLFIIDSPIGNESGEDLAKELAESGGSQVIYLVKNENLDYVSSKMEDLGIVTISKPVKKETLILVLKLVKATQKKMQKLQKQNGILLQKLEDTRTIGKAKCLLILKMNMTEEEAHKYLEKNAMDRRSSKVEIANDIIKKIEKNITDTIIKEG